MKPSRQRLGQAALVVAGIAALGGALGSFGALAWWLELFSHFRPQYAIALLASGVVLLGLRQPVAGLAALGVAVLNAMPLLHYYGIRSASADGEAELQVIAVNLFEYNRQHQRMLDYVRTAAPDIVIFSEATPLWREALVPLGEDMPYQAWTGDVLVASRRPLVNVRALPAIGGEDWALMFSVDVAGRWLTLIGAHAQWPMAPQLAAARNRELGMLGWVASTIPGPLLVLGDLNVTAFSPVFRALLARGDLLDGAEGRGWQPTWPARLPPFGLQIDHCLHDAGVEVVRLRRGPYLGSDHYPLEVGVRLPGVDGAAITASLWGPTSRL